MSSQGFSFPPPPPPPPPTSQQPTYPSHGWNGRGRGRGRGPGNRGRGGAHYHADSCRPPYSTNPSYNYTPGSYGYPATPAPPAPPAPPASYMPPPPPYTQSQTNFQHPQNPPAYQSPQNFPQPAGSAPYPSHPGYNNPAHLAPASYSNPANPSYPPIVSTHQHPAPAGTPMMMNSASWGTDMQPAPGSFGEAPAGRGRGSWSSHPHGNHGPKPRHNNKRDHASAFNRPQKTVPRTPAPPPVPSFGNPLPCKPPPAADATRKTKKRKRKHNQLGLTPKTEEHESSEEEEDVDEESKLAQAGPSTSTSAPLQFTYKGQTATLQSPSDIAAWIAERRKKFPTAARVEEKQKAADEAKAAREAARKEKEKEKTMTKAKECDFKRNGEAADPAVDAAMKAQRKADKIRRNLDREQKRFAKAEAAAEAARLKVEALQKQAQGLNGDLDAPQQNGVGDSIVKDESATTPIKSETSPRDLSSVPAATVTVDGTADHLNGSVDASSHESGSDWTSSSGSESESNSDSEDDSAPEEVSSRRQAPERIPPPPREGKKQLCRHFARNGQCNRGDQCKFSHEVPERGPKHKPQPEKKGRKGLFHALLERQKEDQDRRAMEVISWLGQSGLLGPTERAMPNGAASSDGPA